MTDAQITELIKGRLSEKRFIHSLEVAKEARRLAILYGEDADRLYTAGLLHDAMKDAPPEEQLKMLDESAIILTDIEKSAPKLWHAICGAEFAKKTAGITDSEIISAIRYHTTAKAGMTKFEKILYVADFTSADRDYGGVEDVRRAADEGLEKAMEEGLAFTVTELSSRRVSIHPDTFEAYNEIVLNKGSNKK